VQTLGSEDGDRQFLKRQMNATVLGKVKLSLYFVLDILEVTASR
jgi:hypothetical protein